MASGESDPRSPSNWAWPAGSFSVNGGILGKIAHVKLILCAMKTAIQGIDIGGPASWWTSNELLHQVFLQCIGNTSHTSWSSCEAAQSWHERICIGKGWQPKQILPWSLVDSKNPDSMNTSACVHNSLGSTSYYFFYYCITLPNHESIFWWSWATRGSPTTSK